MNGNVSPDADGLADQPAHAAHKFLVTIFSSVTAKKPSNIEEMTQAELFDLIRSTVAAAKDGLPLLKLARFGDNRSHAGSLRHNANVEAISGIEVEHDAGQMGFDEVVNRLQSAGLCCVVYTTPSHTPARPRWRALMPCSRLLLTQDRHQLVARANGVLGGSLSSESFALSQIFYYGHVEGSETFRAVIAEGDFIDMRDDLDANSIGKVKSTGCGTADAAAHEAHIKAQVNWITVFGCQNLDALQASQADLFTRLQCDLGRGGNLAERWNGGTDGMKDKTRSARDRSIVQILRAMRYEPTEAIACSVAWGGSHPHYGRGLDARDKNDRELDIQRYWVRNWMKPDEDVVPIAVEELLSSPAAIPLPGVRSTPFPAICRRPPGRVGELVDYFLRAMTRVVPVELLVVMSLAAVAYAAQNRFVAGNMKLQTPVQLYLAIIAKTGVGKTELAKALIKLLEGSAARSGIVETMASGPALLSRLDKLGKNCPYGPTMLFLMDELGLKLQARTGKSNNPHVKDLIDEIMILYGRANSTHSGKGYADTKKDIGPIDRPNLNVVGFTTEGPLVEALTGADASTGLVNRFLLASVADVSAPQKRLSEVDRTIPVSLARYMKRVGDPEMRFSAEPSAPSDAKLKEGLRNVQASLPSATIPPAQLQFDRRAEERLDAITDSLNTLADQSDDLVEAIWNRARQQVIVVAAILVIGEIDVDAEERAVPSITSRHVDWAWELVKWSTTNWLVLFNSKISGSEEEAAMNAIKYTLSRVADYAPGGRLADKANYGNATRNGDICAKGWMPASLIGRALRGLRSDIRDRALQALVKNEEIERQDVERSDGQQSGRSTVAYRLLPTGV